MIFGRVNVRVDIRNYSFWVFFLNILFIVLVPKDFLQANYGLRAEDISGLLAIFAFFYIMLSYNLRRSYPIISRFGVAIFLYLVFITLRIILSGDYYLGQFVLLGKELSYYSICVASFLFFDAVFRSEKKRQIVINSLGVVGIILFLDISLQIIYEPRGIYGIAPFGHRYSPLSSGAIYIFASFIFLALGAGFFSSLIKFFLAAASILVGSKIAAVMSLVVIVFSKRKILLAILVFSLIIFLAPTRLLDLLDPLQALKNRGIDEKFLWFTSSDPLVFLFGHGISKGHILADGGFSFSMHGDNLYLFLAYKIGLIGILVYSCLLLYVAFLLRSFRIRAHYIMILAIYLAVGFGAEVFFLSVPGNLFWSIVGYLFFIQHRFFCGQR